MVEPHSPVWSHTSISSLFTSANLVASTLRTYFIKFFHYIPLLISSISRTILISFTIRHRESFSKLGMRELIP